MISTKEERMFGRRTNKNASSKLSSSTSKGGSSRGGEAATRSRIAKKVLPGKNLKKKQQGKSLNSSSNTAPPRRGLRLHDEQGNMIDDEPVQSFISNLSTISAPDEWRERMECLQELVESIPSADILPSVGGVTPWYRSPLTLRRLHVPLSALLADARSVVAKQVTKNVAELVESCSRVASCEGSNSVGDPCRYLLKDLLPAVIALHGQTVSIIKGYAKAMMERIIIACRFKSGLPVLLEKLRKDKSKDVREACVNYISLVITHWSGTQTGGKKSYLTLDICNHLGNGLARAMSDPSQVVRKESRIAFEVYRQKYPKLWSEIVHRPDGPVSKDARLKKGILAAAEKAGQVNGTNIRQQSQQHQQLKPRTSSRNPNPYHQDAQCRGGNMDEDGSVSVHSQGSQSMSSKLSFSSRTSNNSNITGMSGRSYSSLYSKNVFNTAQDTDSASVGSSSSHRSSNIQPPSPSFGPFDDVDLYCCFIPDVSFKFSLPCEDSLDVDIGDVCPSFVFIKGVLTSETDFCGVLCMLMKDIPPGLSAGGGYLSRQKCLTSLDHMRCGGAQETFSLISTKLIGSIPFLFRAHQMDTFCLFVGRGSLNLIGTVS